MTKEAEMKNGKKELLPPKPECDVKVQILEKCGTSFVGKVLEQGELDDYYEPMPDTANFVLKLQKGENYPPVGSVIESNVMLESTYPSCDDDGNYYCFHYYVIFDYKLIE